MDADVLVERILSDLRNAFKKDPLVDEFDILPVHESVRNKCPVIHIDHKIALEDWCVKHVYVYAYTKFFTWRKKPYKVDSDSLLIWTCAILLVNPEIESVWNARKELFSQNVLQLEDELRFSEVALSRKPKSSQVFAHRKWVLLQFKNSIPSPCALQQIIEHEFALCTRVANLYANNYYAWCHRSWVIQELLNVCLKTVSDELTRMEQWISTHISDFSGFHYRQFLISCFSHKMQSKLQSKTSSNCPLHATISDAEENVKCIFVDMDGRENLHFCKALERELLLLSSLQTVYPGHETLWNHRRYILYELKHINTIGESCPVKLKNSDVICIEDAVQCKRHKPECQFCNTIDWNLLKEENFLKQCIKLAKNNDWETRLIERHMKWLKNVVLWVITLPLS